MKYFKLPIIILLLLLTACLDSTDSGYDDTEDQVYLEEYAQRSGVTTTDSGLMYRVLEESEGEQPSSGQHAIITYEGESVDRTVRFDTGESFEIILPEDLNSFTGLGEGVQLMNEGALYEFVLPTELATNDGRVYTFEVRLESFLREDQEQFLVDNATLEGVEETDSGLQYRIIEEGDGETPGPMNTVKIKYKGTFTSGYVFDQSPGNETVEFDISGVIAGFNEGLQLMKEGGKYELFLPPELGYGSNPPQYGTVIKFEVELVEVL